MRSVRGFTLIELLVVISIISILSGVGFVNYKGFSANQDAINASTQIQSLLRLAQSNATSSTKCNNQGATDWSLNFLDTTTLELRCNPNNYLHRSYALESVQIESISGLSSDSGCTLPVALSFSNRLGVLKIASLNSSTACLSSNSWSVKVKSSSDANKFKTFTLNKGGAIDVQ